jgi:hypothetical protein
MAVKANFEYYFIPGSIEIPVFGGLMNIDPDVLHVVPTSNLCIFFAGWTPTLLGDPKYAYRLPDEGDCTRAENCTSFFLPGGVEIARKVRPILNATILEGGVFDNVDVVRIEQAPGFRLQFRHLPGDFTFDLDGDCSYYGMQLNDTLQICAKDMNNSMAVGRSPPPFHLKCQ